MRRLRAMLYFPKKLMIDQRGVCRVPLLCNSVCDWSGFLSCITKTFIHHSDMSWSLSLWLLSSWADPSFCHSNLSLYISPWADLIRAHFYQWHWFKMIPFFSKFFYFVAVIWAVSSSPFQWQWFELISLLELIPIFNTVIWSDLFFQSQWFELINSCSFLPFFSDSVLSWSLSAVEKNPVYNKIKK